MNIPARYCNGYLGDIGIPPQDVPMDFAAWMEVFLGGQWHTFDPRQQHPTHRPGPDGAGPRRRRRRVEQLFRPERVDALSGLDRRGIRGLGRASRGPGAAAHQRPAVEEAVLDQSAGAVTLRATVGTTSRVPSMNTQVATTRACDHVGPDADLAEGGRRRTRTGTGCGPG